MVAVTTFETYKTPPDEPRPGGFPSKRVSLTTVALAGIAGAAGMAGGAFDEYARSLYGSGRGGKRNEARAAAFKARQRKKRKGKR